MNGDINLNESAAKLKQAEVILKSNGIDINAIKNEIGNIVADKHSDIKNKAKKVSGILKNVVEIQVKKNGNKLTTKEVAVSILLSTLEIVIVYALAHIIREKLIDAFFGYILSFIPNFGSYSAKYEATKAAFTVFKPVYNSVSNVMLIFSLTIARFVVSPFYNYIAANIIYNLEADKTDKQKMNTLKFYLKTLFVSNTIVDTINYAVRAVRAKKLMNANPAKLSSILLVIYNSFKQLLDYYEALGSITYNLDINHKDKKNELRPFLSFLGITIGNTISTAMLYFYVELKFLFAELGHLGRAWDNRDGGGRGEQTYEKAKDSYYSSSYKSKEDYLKDLGLSGNPSFNEVKTAFRQKSKETHPDLGGSAEKFQQTKTAYEELKKMYGESSLSIIDSFVINL